LGAAITTRFAPSPTGLLHLGSAYAALVAWRRAREAGGRFLLRIEDIDQTRCRAEYVAAIEEDLRWLGLDWDGPIRRQSEHVSEYRLALDRLAGMGLLYPCICSRADIAAAGSAPQGPDGPIYPGTCRPPNYVDAAGPHALRLDMEAALALTGPLTWFEEGEGRLACDPAAFGDPVLARKDTPSSYHLCVTHDDALQGVTLVTRGADLRPATSLHRLLQTLLGWPEPAYAHHPLLLGPNGQRLAKRDGATTIRAMREQGMGADEISGRLVR
jgi:glutamyl-Q tRNA(Asp) synthetase